MGLPTFYISASHYCGKCDWPEYVRSGSLVKESSGDGGGSQEWLLGDCFRSGVRAVSLTDHPLKTPKIESVVPCGSTQTSCDFSILEKSQPIQSNLDNRNTSPFWSSALHVVAARARFKWAGDIFKNIFEIRSWESAAHVLGDHEEPHNSRVGSQCAQGPRRATQLRGKTFLGTSSLQAEGLHTKRIVWKLTLQRFVERRPLCHCLLSTFIDQIDVPKLSFPSNQPYQKLYRSYQNFQSQKSFHWAHNQNQFQSHWVKSCWWFGDVYHQHTSHVPSFSCPSVSFFQVKVVFL